MGVWGIKIGDSDQVLDIFDDCCRNENYLQMILNRKDIIYYNNMETVLCAIALVDYSINGIIDNTIWSEYILSDKEYMNSLKSFSNGKVRYDLLYDSIYKLDIIINCNQNWNNKEDETERKIIIKILYERLMKAAHDLDEYLTNRKENMKTN